MAVINVTKPKIIPRKLAITTGQSFHGLRLTHSGTLMAAKNSCIKSGNQLGLLQFFIKSMVKF